MRIFFRRFINVGGMSKILIVEDNEMNRDILTRHLKRVGYDTISAMNGEEGVRLAGIKSPDLILMDLNLPVMDGWEATRRLKGAAETKRIPIIAVTAHAMTGDRDKIIRAGCDDYIAKPIDIEALMDKIENLLQE